MQYIDEKFKDESPVKTVEKIQNALKSIGIELDEEWHDSGIENCWSLTCRPKDGKFPTSNGKGITKEFARASAYGEFIERLQSGLFFYKFQSIERDEKMNLHTYAPDKKYMTMQELVENGEWMDYLVQEYGNGLTREKIASQCKMYACTEDDKILTIPFYSLFEDKYVYLPAGFIEHMYSANGCCVGNTKTEAWVHALSEIFERQKNIELLISGESVPVIPEEVLNQFPTVKKILSEIRSHDNLDVKIFDVSNGIGIPVILTRIINKKTHYYLVNTGADPVLEIAIERTLTEIFQGRNIDNILSNSNTQILNKISDFPLTHNVLNLLETGKGSFAVDFFAEEITCNKKCSVFVDNSEKSNKELLEYVLGIYRSMNKQVYVRNYSFLGFPCYKFIVPGFSESRGVRLTEKTQEYAIADIVGRALRNMAKTSDDDMILLLHFYKSIQTTFSRRNSFALLAGIPLKDNGVFILFVSLSYAAYRLKNYAEAIKFVDILLKREATDDKNLNYFACVKQFLSLKRGGIDDDKIRLVLNKFFDSEITSKLFAAIDSGNSPYDCYLLQCDTINCSGCMYNNKCFYASCKQLISSAGKVYSKFTDGQSRENFKM